MRDPSLTLAMIYLFSWTTLFSIYVSSVDACFCLLLYLDTGINGLWPQQSTNDQQTTPFLERNDSSVTQPQVD